MTRPFLILTLYALSAATGSVHANGDAAAPMEALQNGLRPFEGRPASEGPPLTLAAALDEALEQNPTLVALRRQFDAARLHPARERFLMPPTFEAQIWQWPVGALHPADAEMYMFTVRQEIPGRGKREARAAVLDAEAAVVEAHIVSRAREVIESVKRVYADLFLARAHIDIHHSSADLLRQFAGISEARYVTGGVSQQDVLKAIVELSRLHDDILVMEERAWLAEAELNALLARPPDAPIGPIGAPREDVALPASSALQRMALDQHPELQLAALEVERAEAALGAARVESRPDFIVGGGYSLSPRHRDAWTVGVGITWPTAPWARGRADADVAAASAEIEAATARRQIVENAVRLAVQQAYVRVQSASQRAALLRTSVVPQSEHALELARVAYQTDQVDFLAILDHQRTLLEAQLAHSRAASELEGALADLERAIGTELDPLLIAASGGTARVHGRNER